jgi:hypothetical protein
MHIIPFYMDRLAQNKYTRTEAREDVEGGGMFLFPTSDTSAAVMSRTQPVARNVPLRPYNSSI